MTDRKEKDYDYVIQENTVWNKNKIEMCKYLNTMVSNNSIYENMDIVLNSRPLWIMNKMNYYSLFEDDGEEDGIDKQSTDFVIHTIKKRNKKENILELNFMELKNILYDSIKILHVLKNCDFCHFDISLKTFGIEKSGLYKNKKIPIFSGFEYGFKLKKDFIENRLFIENIMTETSLHGKPIEVWTIKYLLDNKKQFTEEDMNLIVHSYKNSLYEHCGNIHTKQLHYEMDSQMFLNKYIGLSSEEIIKYLWSYEYQCSWDIYGLCFLFAYLINTYQIEKDENIMRIIYQGLSLDPNKRIQ